MAARVFGILDHIITASELVDPARRPYQGRFALFANGTRSAVRVTVYHSDNLDGIIASFRLAAIVVRCSAMIRFASSLTCTASTNRGCVDPSNMFEKSCTS